MTHEMLLRSACAWSSWDEMRFRSASISATFSAIWEVRFVPHTRSHSLFPFSKGIDVSAKTGALPLGLLELVVHRGERRHQSLLLPAERFELLPLVDDERIGLGTKLAVLGEVGVGESTTRSLAFLALLRCPLAKLLPVTYLSPGPSSSGFRHHPPSGSQHCRLGASGPSPRARRAWLSTSASSQSAQSQSRP